MLIRGGFEGCFTKQRFLNGISPVVMVEREIKFHKKPPNPLTQSRVKLQSITTLVLNS